MALQNLFGLLALDASLKDGTLVGKIRTALKGATVEGNPTSTDLGADRTGLDVVVRNASPIPVLGDGFDISFPLEVTAVPASVGDAWHGRIELDVAAEAGQFVILDEISILLSVAQTPNLTVYVFDSDPVQSTILDNQPFVLHADDFNKLRRVFQISTGDWITVGSGRMVVRDDLHLAFRPSFNSKKLRLAIVDQTGATLAVNSATIRVAGFR